MHLAKLQTVILFRPIRSLQCYCGLKETQRVLAYLVKPSSPTKRLRNRTTKVSSFETDSFCFAFYRFEVCLLQPTIFFKLKILSYHRE